MNLQDVRAQLEQELLWRQDEMRLLRNVLPTLAEPDQKRYRKALLAMLYAHYEGFCKTALSIYADTVSKEGIVCGDATTSIAASSLAVVFRDFENPQRKSLLFKARLPDDSSLHRFARRVELLDVLSDVWERRVEIPTDVVDTEGNLWPAVVRRMLYLLGLDHTAVDSFEGEIRQLLNWRNDIAHGTRKDGLEDSQYASVETAVYRIMDELVRVVTEALKIGAFKKVPTAA